MPCYLFTFHAYGSWLPDHRRGYVHRGDGILPTDEHMGELYRGNLKQAEVRFDHEIQRRLVDAGLGACSHQSLRCHFVSTEPTHVHVLASWTDDRQWQDIRRQLGSSLTRSLNQNVKRQKWLAKSPSHKRVNDRRHFTYLTTDYLVKHSGVKWAEGRGVFQ